jgi:hypothetical protein
LTYIMRQKRPGPWVIKRVHFPFMESFLPFLYHWKSEPIRSIQRHKFDMYLFEFNLLKSKKVNDYSRGQSESDVIDRILEFQNWFPCLVEKRSEWDETCTVEQSSSYMHLLPILFRFHSIQRMKLGYELLDAFIWRLILIIDLSKTKYIRDRHSYRMSQSVSTKCELSIFHQRIY